MIVYINGHTIYSIRFKKFKFYVNYDSNTFLGNVNIKSKYIKISRETDHSLLKKFKISNADEYTENLYYIKFLIKYSPIFSKLIDNDELESIEIEKIFDDQCFDETKFSNFIELNNGLSFPIYTLTYTMKYKKILIDNIFEQFLKIEKILKWNLGG